MFIYKNKKMPFLILLLSAITSLVFSLPAFGQPKSPCIPYPVSIKKLPPSVRNNPNALKAVEMVNNSPTFKKTIIIDFSSPNIYRWKSTYMALCPGEHMKISATGLLQYIGDNNHPVTNGYTCTPAGTATGTPDISCSDKQFICNSLIARVDRNVGGIGKPFQIGADYNGIVNEAGTLELGINSDDWHHYSGKWEIEIQLSADEKCDFDDGPDLGDVIIYWIGSRIMHSGYVTAASDCKVTSINCYKIGAGYLLHISPDDPRMKEYGHWTIYHSNRRPSRTLPLQPNLINLRTFKRDGAEIIEGITDDENTVIVFGLNGPFNMYKNDFTCHSFTFDNNAHNKITGYMQMANQKVHENDDAKTADQSTAVKYILHNNGYKQVHAEGPDGTQHFKGEYEVENFLYPPQ